ncbi:MAG TPA: enoyl-CoA hydratase-related protein [Blastocatellia bacterium]|nr:enoyl-CoA hydratase-related protein [Blastocatellia bacterium]
MADYQRIEYSVTEGLAYITLNRPEKRNALDRLTLDELGSALRAAEEDAGVKLVILTGAGKDFCAGLDLSELQTLSEASVMENLADARRLANLFLTLRRLVKPVVALVRGRALAGGCGLASACDLLLAAESARFGYPEVKIGFVAAIVAVLLRRSVGEKKAAELILSGRVVTATEAERLGLVNFVYPDEDFDRNATAFIRELKQNSLTAMTLTKRILYEIDALPIEAALEQAISTNALARLTEDFKRGLASFLTKDR